MTKRNPLSFPSSSLRVPCFLLIEERIQAKLYTLKTLEDANDSCILAVTPSVILERKFLTGKNCCGHNCQLGVGYRSFRSL